MAADPSAEPTLDAGSTDDLLRAVARMPSIDLDGFLGDTTVALEPGALISDTFEIRGRLGAGGMGVVYLAEHKQLGRDVALKIATRRSEAAATEHVLREARMMAALVHENVLPIHQVGTLDGRAYIAMEYVEGGTARQWVAARPRMWRQIVDMYVQAGRGLAAAHVRGLVHRDFKPDNVLVAEDPRTGRLRVRVGDFGLARSQEVELDDTRSISADGGDTTKTEHLVGTPAYMAPEQFSGASADAASDQFAFCVALHEALFGERPFSADSLGQLVLAVTAGKRQPPSDDRGVPRRIRRVIDRGLSHRAADRYPTMDALLDELTREPLLRRRSVQVTLAGGLGLAAALTWGNLRDVLDCSDTGVEAPVWDAARVDAIGEAFARSGLPNASDLSERVTAHLGAWITGFQDADRAACEATRVRHERSEGRLELARQCLYARREAFEAAIGVLELGHSVVTARSLDVVEDLPDPQECVDLDALEIADASLSEDERQSLLELRIELAKFSALRVAGLYPEARELAGGLQQRAREVGIPLGLAEVSQELQMLYGSLRQREDAAKTAEEGQAAAIEAGDGKLAASLAIAALFHEGQLRHAEVGAQWDRLATAWVHRLGDPDGATLRLALARGAFFRGQGRFPEAIAEHELAWTMTGRPGTKPGDRIQAGSALGDTYSRASRMDDATRVFEETVALAEATLGPFHPTVANDLNGLAQARLLNGDKERGIEELRRAEKIVVAVHGDESVAHAEILMGLGSAFANLKRFDESEKANLRAIELFRAAGPEQRRRLSQIYGNYGYMLSLRGDHEAAFEATLEAAEIIEKVEPGSIEWANAVANLAGQAHDLGRDDKALEYAELARPVLIESLGGEGHRTAMLDIIAGEALLNLGRFEEAFARCEAAQKVVDDAGADGKWLHQYIGACRGGTRLALGRFQEALDILEPALEELGYDSRLINLRIAASKWGLGRREEAVSEIEALLEEADEDGRDHIKSLGRLLRHWLAAPSSALPASYLPPDDAGNAAEG